MLYKNISGRALYISISMTKTLVQPDEEINLSAVDLNHAGSAIRFFEPVKKDAPVAVATPVVEEKVEEKVEEPTVVENEPKKKRGRKKKEEVETTEEDAKQEEPKQEDGQPDEIVADSDTPQE